MFKFKELKKIHLEITNNCQASCPMCARNVNGGLPNPLIKIQNWSLNDFKHIMNNEVFSQIENYYFCGNFGDPILNNDLLDMCKYSKEIAPSVHLAIHTNGGARNTEWWEELAKSLPLNHRVVFALDGMQDTHSIYRIGTSFDKVIENAKSFIDAGGNAEWVFIRFKHNEHQVDDARQLSKNLGFSKFTLKNSSRFIGEPKISVLDKHGNFTHHIEPASDTPMKFIDKKMIDSFSEIAEKSVIDCKVLQEKEIYIDAYKKLYPCCHTASIPYIYRKQENISAAIDQMLIQHNEMIEKLGNTNIMERSISEIIESESYQTVWDYFWKIKKLLICARTCGKTDDVKFSLPREQWQS